MVCGVLPRVAGAARGGTEEVPTLGDRKPFGALLPRGRGGGSS